MDEERVRPKTKGMASLNNGTDHWNNYFGCHPNHEPS